MKQRSKRHKGTEGKKRFKSRFLRKSIIGISIIALTFVLFALPNTMAQEDVLVNQDYSEPVAVKTAKEDDAKKAKMVKLGLQNKQYEAFSAQTSGVSEKTDEESSQEESEDDSSNQESEDDSTNHGLEDDSTDEESEEELTINDSNDTESYEEVSEIEESDDDTYDEEEQYEELATEYSWDGEVLTADAGRIQGPSGEETYYNLPMDGCIELMKNEGYDFEYSVRDDGVKLYGGYVMVAADLESRPKGTLVQTSLGLGIVVDTGGFAEFNKTQLDIATTW